MWNADIFQPLFDAPAPFEKFFPMRISHQLIVLGDQKKHGDVGRDFPQILLHLIFTESVLYFAFQLGIHQR